MLSNSKLIFIVAWLISLFLVSCASDPKTLVELEGEIKEAEKILEKNEMLDELEALAKKDYVKYTLELQAKPLADLLAPINAKFEIFQAKFEQSKLTPHKDNKTSIIFAAIGCYYEEADIRVTEDGSCQATDKRGKDISDAFLSTVAAVPAQVGANGSVTMALQAEEIQQLLTYDPSQEELLKNVYMFGDTRFDLLYVVTVASKVKVLTSSVLSDPSLMISQGYEIVAGGMFVKNLLQVLGQAAEAGGKIVSKVTESIVGG